MPTHGELIVEYRIYSVVGADIVLTRTQAITLLNALALALDKVVIDPKAKK